MRDGKSSGCTAIFPWREEQRYSDVQVRCRAGSLPALYCATGKKTTAGAASAGLAWSPPLRRTPVIVHSRGRGVELSTEWTREKETG